MNRAKRTPLSAAIAAAQEFKSLLDRLPANTPLFPGRPKRLRESASYAHACSLLQEAIPQGLQISDGIGDERWVVLPLPCVVSNQGADVPANQLELFASVTVTIAQLALQIVDECRGSGEDGRLLEIGTRLLRKVDLAGEKVEGERNAVHEDPLKEVVGRTLCHGEELVDQLLTSAFDPASTRTRRSAAYKAGAHFYLHFKATGCELPCTSAPGSAEFDAYCAGMDEGRAIWKRHQAEAAQ